MNRSEKGPYYVQGVLAVIAQIENTGFFDLDPVARLLNAAYFDQAKGTNILTPEEQTKARKELDRRGWTLEQGKEYAAGVRDTQTILAVYATKNGE
jgi:hypothetical protein